MNKSERSQCDDVASKLLYHGQRKRNRRRRSFNQTRVSIVRGISARDILIEFVITLTNEVDFFVLRIRFLVSDHVYQRWFWIVFPLPINDSFSMVLIRLRTMVNEVPRSLNARTRLL